MYSNWSIKRRFRAINRILATSWGAEATVGALRETPHKRFRVKTRSASTILPDGMMWLAFKEASVEIRSEGGHRFNLPNRAGGLMSDSSFILEYTGRLREQVESRQVENR